MMANLNLTGSVYIHSVFIFPRVTTKMSIPISGGNFGGVGQLPSHLSSNCHDKTAIISKFQQINWQFLLTT